MNNKINVIDIINLVSIDSFVNVLDKFPILKEIVNKSKNGVDDWGFYMTSAGAGLVLISSETYKGEHKEIKKRGSELFKQLPESVDNFIDFMNKSEVEDNLLPAKIGMWVIWNLKQSTPTDDELKELAPFIGRFLIGIISKERSKG